MTRWNIEVSDETDRSVRKYLEHTSRDQNDLSEFVDHAVRQAIFWETVDAIQERNKHLSPEEAQRLADDAVTEARAHRS